jgi:pimeloyl-ACP methyl ester carboxylesterase
MFPPLQKESPLMTPGQFHASRQTVTTPSGAISYVENGNGPAALFIHGVPLNGYHWRHAMHALGDLRRCLAPDLMGLGYTEVAAHQEVTFDAQAEMLVQFLDALTIERIDLIGNDSGGAIAQILATKIPLRIRSLTLTNCDVHDNWPPPAFAAAVARAKAGQFAQGLAFTLANPASVHSGAGLGAAFQFPERLTAELLDVYLRPITTTTARQHLADRYVAGMDCAQTVRIYDRLKVLPAPALIVWADSDIFFPVQWAHWLGQTLPGTRKVAVLEGARLFFPEERPDEFCALVREHWQNVPV